MPRVPSATCKNNHPWSEDNTGSSGGTKRRCLACRREYEIARREKLIGSGRMKQPALYIKYEYETWISGATFYIKVIAIEYERATEDSFALAARRKTRRELARLGYDETLARGIGALAVWDRSKNWADLMVETVTYQLTRPLPIAADEAA